jgi:Terminase large subunit, T4likevirus-type, N-terminal
MELIPTSSSTNKKAYALSLIKQYKALQTKEPLKFYKFYDWQKEALNALEDHIEMIMIAANRVGKTLTACSCLAFILTGDYPDWYKGPRFNFSVRALALGVSGEQIKDVIQRVLIGEVEIEDGRKIFKGGGLIPPNLLRSPIWDRAIPGLLREIKVVHKNGFRSSIKFRSYSQGPHVLRGPYYDIILCDEEPHGDDALIIYGEMLARIMMGNKGKGGRLMLTFTPENGITPLVDLLYNNSKKGQYLLNVGWDDAPHLSQAMKEHLLSTIPPHLILAKSKGIPTFGEHKVFKIPEADIMIDPFPIPNHFKILTGVDFGFAHPFAACFCALDMDRGITYIFDGWEMTNGEPAVHSGRINHQFPKIRIVYPHDGDSHEKSGMTIKSQYTDAGANMYALFKNDDGTNHIWPGLMQMDAAFKNGTIKVFSTVTPFWISYRKFRTNPNNGKLQEHGKDFMDAARYCVVSIEKHGQLKSELGLKTVIKKSYPRLNL